MFSEASNCEDCPEIIAKDSYLDSNVHLRPLPTNVTTTGVNYRLVIIEGNIRDYVMEGDLVKMNLSEGVITIPRTNKTIRFKPFCFSYIVIIQLFRTYLY